MTEPEPCPEAQAIETAADQLMEQILTANATLAGKDPLLKYAEDRIAREERLKAYVEALGSNPDGTDVRTVAAELAEILGLPSFATELAEIAGDA